MAICVCEWWRSGGGQMVVAGRDARVGDGVKDHVDPEVKDDGIEDEPTTSEEKYFSSRSVSSNKAAMASLCQQHQGCRGPSARLQHQQEDGNSTSKNAAKQVCIFKTDEAYHELTLSHRADIVDRVFEQKIGLTEDIAEALASLETGVNSSMTTGIEPVYHHNTQAVPVHQQQLAYYGQPRILGSAPVVHPSQATSLSSDFSTMSLQDATWNMDTGATSHLISNARNLSTIFNKCLFLSIHVGDANFILVTNTEHSIIPSIHCPLHLHNVLVTLNIIKNLISVSQFTRDNNCTIEFDAFGFSVKDFLTRHILL
ncbi:hypothetical protein Tco_1058798 [Tanacetum coccineum]|uniref:Uncharacterized protein n=1 Tax=Tanacetum coccineum TaxID=301880 RepID=A0ABQ5H9A1_9ASTR